MVPVLQKRNCAEVKMSDVSELVQIAGHTVLPTIVGVNTLAWRSLPLTPSAVSIVLVKNVQPAEKQACVSVTALSLGHLYYGQGTGRLWTIVLNIGKRSAASSPTCLRHARQSVVDSPLLGIYRAHLATQLIPPATHRAVLLSKTETCGRTNQVNTSPLVAVANHAFIPQWTQRALLPESAFYEPTIATTDRAEGLCAV